MPRKTATITIDAEGRDKGKTFFLTELAGNPAERWFLRAISVAAKSGVPVPENIRESGFPGFSVLLMRALLAAPFHEVEPLLSEMFACVQFIPDPARPSVIRPLVDLGSDGDDIEEVMTRLRLREEVIDLHVGFFKAVVDLMFRSPTPAAESETLSST